MNKTSAISSNFLSFKINEKENYSFSTRGREFLCLNKRLVEIGIGTCLVAVYLKGTTYEEGPLLLNRDFELNYAKLVFIFDYMLPVGLGLYGLMKAFGYQGLSFLLLWSALQRSTKHVSDSQNPADFQTPKEFGVLLQAIGSAFATIGRSIMLVGCLGIFLVSSSFLINQYAWQSLCKMLAHFNNWQNVAVSGTLEIKNNLKYQISLFGRDVFCLNKTLLNTYFILCCLLTCAYDFENRNNTRSPIFEEFLGIVGISVAQIICKSYRHVFNIILSTICMTAEIQQIRTAAILIEIGSGMLYGGIGLIIFTLLSYLIKKTDNKQGIKILNYLKDKKREAEYNQDIENQRKTIEQRNKEISKKNDSRHNNPINENNESYSTEIKHTKPAPKNNKKIDQPTPKTQNKNITECVVIKKDPLLETKKEYTTNLTGDHLKTWNQLFEITKSKPDHLTISSKKVINLITTLGGTITKSGKRYHVYFGNKNLGSFEITHGKGKTKDKAGQLTADYAQNVKIAIESAIESGYISKNFVEVKIRS